MQLGEERMVMLSVLIHRSLQYNWAITLWRFTQILITRVISWSETLAMPPSPFSAWDPRQDARLKWKTNTVILFTLMKLLLVYVHEITALGSKTSLTNELPPYLQRVFQVHKSKLNLPFYLKILSVVKMPGNLEFYGNISKRIIQISMFRVKEGLQLGEQQNRFNTCPTSAQPGNAAIAIC